MTDESTRPPAPPPGDQTASVRHAFKATRRLAMSVWASSLSLCAVCLVALPSNVVAQQSVAAPQTIDKVAWLQGCWEATSGRSVIDEQWMAPRGSTMLMMGRTVRDGKLVEYEVVLVREEGGTLVYEAHPSGQSPATFRSTSLSEGSVVFENPEHDFPKTIGYRQDRPDSLLAWVEGPSGGQTRRVEFKYQRATCPGASR